MSKTRIVYSRAMKEYHLVSRDPLPHEGIIEIFPAGHKADAEVFQLQYEAPEIAAAVKELAAKYPLKGRAFRGGQILAFFGVVPDQANGTYLVVSQTKPLEVSYRVSLNHHACSCPDWENGAYGHQHGAPTIDGHTMCKHLVAVQLFEQLQQQEGENHE